MRYVIIFIMIFFTIICKAQNTFDAEMYYYFGYISNKRHHDISWIISGVSDTFVVCDCNLCCEDSLISSFMDKTNHLAPIERGNFFVLSKSEAWAKDEYDKEDSLVWSLKEKIKYANAHEYKFILQDSTILYLSMYKIRGKFREIKKLVWSTRNPPRDLFTRHDRKTKYLLYSLFIANAIELEDWHIQILKEKNVKIVY